MCLNDQRTVMERTLACIEKESNMHMEALTPKAVKLCMEYKMVPENEAWKVGVVLELLELGVRGSRNTHLHTN